MMTVIVTQRRCRKQAPVDMHRYLALLRGADPWHCAGLALLSTAIWFALYKIIADPGYVDPESLTAALLGWLSGAVYSILVLFRYIDGAWRLAAVVVAGMLCYWAGICISVCEYNLSCYARLPNLEVMGGPVPWWQVIVFPHMGLEGEMFSFSGVFWHGGSTIVAGAVTGLFVGIIAVGLGRLRCSAFLLASAGLAGAVGGGVIDLSLAAENWPLFVVGHGAWQILTCTALHAASRREPDTHN